MNAHDVAATDASGGVRLDHVLDERPGCRPDLLSIGDLMARGWSIIPVKPHSKIPAVRWEEFQRRHATVEEIEEWFTTPGFNVGVVCGRISRIFVVDADTEAAVEWARETLPPCDLRVKTAKGLHLYYPYSGARPLRNKVRVKYQGETLDLDFRAEGGFVVGPGSVHESGHIYRARRRGMGMAMNTIEPNAIEQQIADLLPDVFSDAKSSTFTSKSGGHATTIPNGQRNATLTSLAGAMRRKGLSASAMSAALQVVNRERCHPPLAEREVEDIAANVGRYAAADAIAAHDPRFRVISDLELLSRPTPPQLVEGTSPRTRSAHWSAPRKRGRPSQR